MTFTSISNEYMAKVKKESLEKGRIDISKNYYKTET